MSSNTEKVVKIVSILIIGGLFIGFMMWLRNSMKTNCGVDEEFSKDLNKCIPKCKGDTVYDDTKGKCIIKCSDTEIQCKGTCYPGTYKCLNDGTNDIPCLLTQTLCGSNCIDNNTQMCLNVNNLPTVINNDNPKLCKNKTIFKPVAIN